MSTHKGRLVTTAIVDKIAGAGLAVNAGHAPAGAGEQLNGTFVGYVVVHPTPGGTYDGPIAGTDDDARPSYTITSIGASVEQCQWVADKARDALRASPLVIAGRAVQRVDLESDGGAIRDDTTEPQVWFCPDRWRIYTTDAT